jgi:tellurite resistance protein TerA
VTLTKSAPSVSLTKGGASGGQLTVNLNWNPWGASRPPGGGLLGKLRAVSAPNLDLDLACLWELTDGRKGVVQALGNAFGNLQGPPFVRLDGDDRTGSNVAGETLRVNLEALPKIRRILVFAYIYEGAPNWAAAAGTVTLTPPTGPQIEVHLDEHDSRAPTCVIALLENVNGELMVRREVRYIRGAQDAVDRAYGWGMDWTPGRKD